MSTNPERQEGCILVVDDEEEARETLRDAIEAIGCSAITAGSGREALSMLSIRRPCLIVLDLLMPGMTGAEVLSAIRADSSLNGVPVVLVTSAPHRAPAGVPVVPKPIALEEFWSRIRGVCHCQPQAGLGFHA